MKHINLTKGYVAVVDDEDFIFLSEFKWRVSVQRRKGCLDQITAIANLPSEKKGKPGKTVYMHRLLLETLHGSLKNKIVDHINHNKLDNRKANLRFATRQQNSANMRKKKGKSSSKYKGVCFTGYKNKPWRMGIKINGVAKYKSFLTEIEAAQEYNKRAAEAFGEFAYLNKL